MKEFWNQRYGDKKYAYGVRPNEFFKDCLEGVTPGKMLLPAEGEGRNAVYAASLGWQVSAFDSSKEGRNKCNQLALEHGVEIDYEVGEFSQVDYEPHTFQALGLIYAHMPASIRRGVHQQLLETVEPGGLIILEAFSPHQLGKSSGGPQSLNMLYSLEELKTDFLGVDWDIAEEKVVILDEGEFHSGEASVIRLVGVKE